MSLAISGVGALGIRQGGCVRAVFAGRGSEVSVASLFRFVPILALSFIVGFDYRVTLRSSIYTYRAMML